MNTTNPKTMLFTHSWFTSKEYKLDSDTNTISHLSVSEASMNRATSEKFPLDMIEATPQLTNKIDPQLLTAALVCALAAGVFLTLSATANLTTLSIFGGLFVLTTIAAIAIGLRNKVRSYTYFYTGSNTPMFTLTSKQADKDQVEAFVKSLNHSIKRSTADDENIKTVGSTNTSLASQKTPKKEQATNTEEQEYLAYTYHLDFLFVSGLIDDESYLNVGHNISERVFGSKQSTESALAETNGTSNIINFPR